MKILEGKTLSDEILENLKERVKKLSSPVRLTIINYYENSPSSVYMKLKIKTCEKIGIETKVIIPDIKDGKEKFLKILEEVKNDKNCDALMVERPLPEGFDDIDFWDNMPAEKDVDCLSSINNGKLYISKNIEEMKGKKFFVPCTALASIKILERYNFSLKGKNSVVVGRSAIVGKPLAHMLSSMDSTVTLCHSKTQNIEKFLKEADFIFLAIGKAKWLKKEMIGQNQVIIDIGTNFDENNKMCGDADFEDVKDKTFAITPVPKGVGPVTLALLLEASVLAAEKKQMGGL